MEKFKKKEDLQSRRGIIMDWEETKKENERIQKG
jgi:hypothetical protein